MFIVELVVGCSKNVVLFLISSLWIWKPFQIIVNCCCMFKKCVFLVMF